MSDWKKSAAARRDERHAKDESPAPNALAGRAPATKKDTKRWCGGHVGREHQPVCTPEPSQPPGHAWRILQCCACGRKLDHYYPMTFRREDGTVLPETPKPAWVR